MLNISGNSTCTPTKEVTIQDHPNVLTLVKTTQQLIIPLVVNLPCGHRQLKAILMILRTK